MAKATLGGAHYLDGSAPKKKSARGRLAAIVSSFAALAVLGTTLGMGSLVSTDSRTAENVKSVAAEASICGVIGTYMDSRGDWRSISAITLPEVSGRYFALPEVVGNGLWWSTFKGAGGETVPLFVEPYDKEIESINNGRNPGDRLPLTSALPSELQNFRNFDNCTYAQIHIFMGNVGLNLANVIANTVGWIATTAFNPSFICDPDPLIAAQQGACMDLIAVIGGRSNDAGDGGTGQGSASGVIGSLTTGLYQPLVMLVVLATALLIAWTGIVKRQYRQAFGQAIWLVLSFLIGLTLLLNPSMLVKAPMIAGNTLLSCIVGAFTNSNGCLNGGAPVDLAQQPANRAVCISGASSASPAQQTSFYINSMACSIWSAFVLEPYARGAFGVGVAGLEMNSPVDGGANTVGGILSGPGWNYGNNIQNAATNPGDDGNYCVRLGSSSQSYNTMPDMFTGDRGPQICNLAVWDLLMKVNYTGGGIDGTRPTPDATWYEMMSRLPASDQLFTNYTNSGAASWNKFGMGGIAWLTTAVGGFIIAFTSIASLVYYVLFIVMIAFAPLFFLIGLHPGRGKKLMLGWVEQIISNFLKYLVSAIFVLITITFYGVILGASSDLWASVIFIILITAALLMYRKELINILGRVEMGGEKITNAADTAFDLGNKGRNWGQRMARGTTAGAVAGAVTRKGLVTGARAGIMRELRASNGPLGRTLQAASMLSTDSKGDARGEIQRKREAAQEARAEAATLERDLNEAIDKAIPEVEEISTARNRLDNTTREVEEANALADVLTLHDGQYGEAVLKIALKSELGQKNPDAVQDYSDYRNLEDNGRVLAEQLRVSLERGDTKRAKGVEAEIDQNKKQMDSIASNHSKETFSAAAQAYEAAESFVINDASLDDKTRNDFREIYDTRRDERAQQYKDNALATAREGYRLVTNDKEEYEKLLEQWNKGTGAVLEALEIRALDAKEAAGILSAQVDARARAIADYENGDIRTVKGIQKDMKKADAKGTKKFHEDQKEKSDNGERFGFRTDNRLDEIKKKVGGRESTPEKRPDSPQPASAQQPAPQPEPVRPQESDAPRPDPSSSGGRPTPQQQSGPTQGGLPNRPQPKSPFVIPEIKSQRPNPNAAPKKPGDNS